MEYRTREWPMKTPCPHCGGGLLSIEAGVVPAEFDQPTSWERTRIVCPRKCLLMGGDVDPAAT